jgi:hypothetical protein
MSGRSSDLNVRDERRITDRPGSSHLAADSAVVR